MDPMTRDLSCDETMPPTRGRPVGAVPGVVIPPESLRTLWVLSHDILDLSQELEHGDIQEVALELESRLSGLFLADQAGRRPCHGDEARYASDPHWKDLVLFHEYFDGETGLGLGASHQTGWTGLVASLIDEWRRPAPPSPR